MRLRSKTELVTLVTLAYGPFLASSPGRVSADSKQDLYLDPGRFLSRAADLWDPHVGAGGVPHQNLGYLFPTAPWFWLLDRAGIPDWVAQRLWLGTISLVAVLGARWLFHQLGAGPLGALAGALVYLLSPYQLAFTARMSVLLLPWAALPWLVGVTMRATRTRDWRAPALVGIALVLAGGINASSLLFVALGPVVWLVLEACGGRGGMGRALRASGRLAVVGLGVSMWWLVGLRLQGAHGLPVLQLTESTRTVAEWSTPSELLRGMGNWFFFGRDRTGYSVDQAAAYAGANRLVVALSYAVPASGLVAAFLLRWAHRTFFTALVVVGTVVGVGSWPFADPTPYGAWWKVFTRETSVGLALRNTPRVAPLVVLGLAGLLAGAVGAVPAARWRQMAGASVAAMAGAALLPVWQHGYLTKSMQRPASVPAYWLDATRAMDLGDHATRVLEIPGSSFAAYRWGTTVDPITPALIDRPYLAREVLPAGGVGTANVLEALDRRMQQGTFEAASLAPIARLLGVGTVSFRADLDQSGRFDTPPPAPLWAQLLRARGLESPRTFGPPGGDGSDPKLPSVALFDVEDPSPILRVAPQQRPVVVAGDGDGLVDAAGAGVLDGSSLVLESASLDRRALQRALRAGADLVITDSNRRRAQTWFYSLRDTRGETERAGRTAPDPTGYDFRLDPFPGSGDDARTVVVQTGGRVEASVGGGPERPEDRGAHAVDGDPTTAWRVGSPTPAGATLTVFPARPVQAKELRILQPAPPPGGRALSRVRVQVDDERALDVDLDASSYSGSGQVVPIAPGTTSRLEITLLGVAPVGGPGGVLNPVGLSEVTLGDLRVDETVRPPVDLLTRAGRASSSHRLDIVLARLRAPVPPAGHSADERRLDRRLDLPTSRSFGLSGTVRLRAGGAAPGADGSCRSDLLRLDGGALPVRVLDEGGSLALHACAPLDLKRGSHRLQSTPGTETGLDVDRLILSSGADGSGSVVAARGAPFDGAGATVTTTHGSATHLGLHLRTDGRPFWLVLGQSRSTGWTLDLPGATVGPGQLVDGYANGWLVTPTQAGDLTGDLGWGPQRLLWMGLAVSALALASCLFVLWRGRRRPWPVESDLVARPNLQWDPSTSVARTVPALRRAAVVTLLACLVVPVPVAVVAGLILLVSWRLPYGVLLLVVAAPAALLVSRASHRPSLAWVAVVLLGAEVLRARADDGRTLRDG